MPQSLHRTWVALAVAALAVLVVLGLAGRDFARNVNAPCPGTLEVSSAADSPFSLLSTDTMLDPVYMESISPSLKATPTPVTHGPVFRLHYDEKKGRAGYGSTTEYKNVRVTWSEPGADAASPCTCGSIAIPLSGELPSDLRLYYDRSIHAYVLKGRSRDSQGFGDDVRAVFKVVPGASHHLQSDRIFSRQHLPLGVALFAAGALVVALLRSRRAMAYALRIHGWTEARLTPSGLVESDTGETLGALEQTRLGRIPPGPVLVAPEALTTTGLYRDVPIIARRHVAEGTHSRWATGTMLRLRDARALAVISTACTLLAFGARLIA